MRGAIVWAFVRHELRDLRSNARVLPVLLVMPALSVLVPILLVVVAPLLVEETTRDPAMAALLRQALAQPGLQGRSLEEALVGYLLRGASGFYLLMPAVLASTAAAFSIVGEKQQRTLEPVLATPITDREFLAAKLAVCMIPTLVATWGASLLAALGVDLVTLTRYGSVVLPDRFWIAGTLVLSLLCGAAVALLTMRMSARSVDPQATVQASALVILPATLVLFGVLGRVLLDRFEAVLIVVALMVPLDLWLFRRVERTFRREEILTRWR